MRSPAVNFMVDCHHKRSCVFVPHSFRIESPIYEWSSLMRCVAVVVCQLVCCAAVLAQEEPVALLEAGRAEALWLGDHLYVTVEPGQIFHTGDRLRTSGQPATVLFCPDRIKVTVALSSEISFWQNRLKLEKGKLVEQEVAPNCTIPQIARTYSAPDYHIGQSASPPGAVLQSRSLDEALGALGPEREATLRDILRPLDRATASNPADVEARLTRIRYLEANDLRPQTLDDLRALDRLWPGNTWVKRRIFLYTEEQSRTAAVAAPPREGKTHALLVGISNYESSKIQPLDFAHKDAELFASFLRTPRAGPLASLRVLENEKATLGAIDNAFAETTKAAGPNDTIFIAISAHGTAVGTEGFILTYDSLPSNLRSTALHMTRLMNLITAAAQKAARVVVLLDVRRAGRVVIGQSGNNIYKVLESIITGSKDLFVFAACDPSQVSVEDARLGHGVFSYYVLRALNGDAEQIRDGVITVRELVDY